MSYLLRCWARHEGDGALCTLPSEHRLEDMHEDLRTPDCTVWWDSDCAFAAGPEGRETAALRILELHHRADLLAFQAGRPVDDRLRAVAARLLAGPQAAATDRESILNDYTTDGSLWAEPRRAELWLAAADLLKPWTGAT
jgi:hypothetical protein